MSKHFRIKIENFIQRIKKTFFYEEKIKKKKKGTKTKERERETAS